jgi:methylmalonyl-CoA mutase C-terminal domain/subunit
VVGLLKENKAEDISLSIGGIIPDEDKEALNKIGVDGVFGPGTDTKDIVEFIRKKAGKKV